MMFYALAFAGPMTPTQAVGDFDAILGSLQSMYIHPERLEDEEFDGQVLNIRMKLATVETTRDFWLATSPLVASLEDGHTYLVPPLETEGAASRVPIDVDLHDGHVYLTGEDGIPKDPIRILKIGEEDADAFMNGWLAHFSGEHRAFKETWIEEGFEHLYPWWTDAETLKLELEDGSTRTVKVRGVGTAAVKTEDPWSSERKGDLEVLRIASFRMDPKAFKKGLKTFFKDLESEPPEALVIDVQGNAGGNVENLRQLLPYLVDPWRVYSKASVRELQKDGTWSPATVAEIEMQKGSPTYSGPVYVLTDSSTFATGADLATSLSDLKRATIVGEPPGGMPSSTGNLVKVPLPSGQVLYVATAAFVRADPTRGDGLLEVDIASAPDDALPKIREHLKTR